MRTTGFTAEFVEDGGGSVMVFADEVHVVLEQEGEQVWIPVDEFIEYLDALKAWAAENI